MQLLLSLWGAGGVIGYWGLLTVQNPGVGHNQFYPARQRREPITNTGKSLNKLAQTYREGGGKRFTDVTDVWPGVTSGLFKHKRNEYQAVSWLENGLTTVNPQLQYKPLSQQTP